MIASFSRLFRLLVVGVVVSIGCSRGPKAIPKFKVDAKAAWARVLELYDQDQDGNLSPEELKQEPALNVISRIDANGDQSLDESEFVDLIEGWNEKSLGLMSLRCTVTLGGRALAGANVTLQPAPFLEGQIESSIGLTDEYGDAFLTVPKEKRPIVDSPPGVQFGLYRVVISKLKDGKETIPAKYNVETVLGQEVSFDDPGVQNGIRYELKRR